MIKNLTLTNVGPSPKMELEFGARINLITGDNGLGKSFLLDIVWWALTRKWPAELNNNLTSGRIAIPSKGDTGKIEFTTEGKSKSASYQSTFDRSLQSWTGKKGRPLNPGLVLYAQIDGSFGVWDPARNYWKTQGNVDVQERQPAFVFSPQEVWDGLPIGTGKKLCNGLIADWAGWQKEKGAPYNLLKAVLSAISPSEQDQIVPGELTRISLDDVRDIPTLRMPYLQDVPVLHASAGMRRIISLAYLLVWAWDEHQKACHLLGEKNTEQVVFLIDEIEAHLHPKWQRRIIHALLSVMKKLTKAPQVQIITATHSPLVLASVEPVFDESKDAWFDLDFVRANGSSGVELTRRPFIRRGNVSNWLTSDAFDLPSAVSLEAEQVLQEAAIAMSAAEFDAKKAKKLESRLRAVLGDTDPFWMRWRFVGEKKRWL